MPPPPSPSAVDLPGGLPAGAVRLYLMRPGDAERLEGFRARSVLASYCHLHFLSNPQVAEALVEACRDPSLRSG